MLPNCVSYCEQQSLITCVRKDAPAAATSKRTRLLNVKQHDDKSGYDFARYQSRRKTAR